PMASGPAFLFDLDGTLVDSVYQHVLAWREALESGGIKLSVWRIHRRIGMSGGLFINALLRETGGEVSPEQVNRIQRVHAEAYAPAATVKKSWSARGRTGCIRTLRTCSGTWTRSVCANRLAQRCCGDATPDLVACDDDHPAGTCLPLECY